MTYLALTCTKFHWSVLYSREDMAKTLFTKPSLTLYVSKIDDDGFMKQILEQIIHFLILCSKMPLREIVASDF